MSWFHKKSSTSRNIRSGAEQALGGLLVMFAAEAVLGGIAALADHAADKKGKGKGKKEEKAKPEAKPEEK